jgi:uncharacterized RDD family membrane protein YckC
MSKIIYYLNKLLYSKPLTIYFMENVKLAGFGKRFLAYIIDGILLSVVLSIVLIPFGGLLGIMGMKAAESGGDMTDEAAVATAAMAGISFGGIILVALVVPIVYDALMTASEKQGTLGKMAMKIKVVKENGERLNTTDAFVRALLKSIIGGACAFLWLVCLFNKQEQNLHDMAAKTLVVSAE